MSDLISQSILITDNSQLDESSKYIFVTSEYKLIGAGSTTSDYIKGVFDINAQPSTKFLIEKHPEKDALKLICSHHPGSYITAVGETFPLIAKVGGDSNWSLFQLIFRNGAVSIKSTHPGCGAICYVQLIGPDKKAHLAATIPDDKWGVFHMYKVQ